MDTDMNPQTMSFDQWAALKDKTLARAQDLAAHINGLAAVAAAEGLRVQAGRLQVLALQPMIVAKKFLAVQLDRVTA